MFCIIYIYISYDMMYYALSVILCMMICQLREAATRTFSKLAENRRASTAVHLLMLGQVFFPDCHSHYNYYVGLPVLFLIVEFTTSIPIIIVYISDVILFRKAPLFPIPAVDDRLSLDLHFRSIHGILGQTWGGKVAG